MSGFIYRGWSRLLHRFNLHHTKISHPNGETQDWCHWCGLRMTRFPQGRRLS